MPQTDPFTYNVAKKMSNSELARALRLDAAAELDAMNLYEAHIEATDNEDAKKVLAFIAKDEKEHYALFVELIRRLDPDQAEEMAGAGPKLDTILSAPAGKVEEEAVEAAGDDGAVSEVAEERDLLRRVTVGSLLGRLQE
ncbi:MAG TPA: demethoxyubiquinone hydroxylase family protein [Chloroflexota bacterium]|nr:demethoxyubiquinone hydroxylase family protein [Chloroflexota bacterium]